MGGEQRPDIRNWKSRIGDQKAEIGDQGLGIIDWCFLLKVNVIAGRTIVRRGNLGRDSDIRFPRSYPVVSLEWGSQSERRS
jgi:hypothetical protein